MVNILFEPHVNSPLVVFSALAAIPAGVDGGNFRHASVWSCVFLMTTMAISANMQNDLREYRISSALGAAGGAMFAVLPRWGWFRIGKWVPHSVSSGVGCFYIGYHGYQYAQCRLHENNGDVAVNW